MAIGLGLYAKDSVNYSGTPIIRAVRVKFHNMTTDVFRWSLPLQISDDQTLLDNDVNPYSASAQRAHLDTFGSER